MDIITDVAASPAVAVPLLGGTALANLIAILPVLINIGMLIYICLLVGHKAWVWYREWKGKQMIKDSDG